MRHNIYIYYNLIFLLYYAACTREPLWFDRLSEW